MSPLKKLLKSKKAISTLIITVILVAAVISMGIILLAWAEGWLNMFQTTSQVTIDDATFTAQNITLYVNNRGSSAVVLSSLKVNDVIYSTSPALPATLGANSQLNLNITISVVWGNSYGFQLRLSNGMTVTYEEIAS